jgi:orotate phosphoribosyltransferase
MVSIFNYGFPQARDSFEKAGVNCLSLTDYPSLIDLALEKKLVKPEEQEILLKWRDDPANWKGVL